MKYHVNGEPIRKSTGKKKKMEAREVMKMAEAGIAPTAQAPSGDAVTFERLSGLLVRDYRINGKKSLVRAQISVNRLAEFFQGKRAGEITTALIDEYIEERMQWSCLDCKRVWFHGDRCPFCGSERVSKGAANATINRELSALKRMMRIGAEHTPPLVERVPAINMLKENNTRKGFFEHDEFERLRKHLPPHLKPIVTMGYKTGWRMTEILTLPWTQVDRHNGCARVEADITKGDEARTIYFDSELKALIDELWDKRKQRRSFCPYVFVNRKGTDRNYRFDRAWATACRKAGVDRIFHDLRRTAVRNMVRAGVPEGIAMKISGHKTRSVFERYNIVNDEDLKRAAKQQEAYLETQGGHALGTSLGTLPKPQSKRG
ncbi:tyrosine-type recombinase/integrase [Desulfoluna butyratoxydans]|nr:site-specific integrase [Desulfoluna butyratoxydans]